MKYYKVLVLLFIIGSFFASSCEREDVEHYEECKCVCEKQQDIPLTFKVSTNYENEIVDILTEHYEPEHYYNCYEEYEDDDKTSSGYDDYDDYDEEPCHYEDDDDYDDDDYYEYEYIQLMECDTSIAMKIKYENQNYNVTLLRVNDISQELNCNSLSNNVLDKKSIINLLEELKNSPGKEVIIKRVENTYKVFKCSNYMVRAIN